MRYSTSFCPKCKAAIKPFGLSYIAIGNPFIKCHKCETLVRMSHIDEWESMHFLKKIWYYFIASVWPLFWGCGIGAIVPGVMDEFLNINVPMFLYLGLIFLGGLIGVFISIRGMQKEIQKSKERTLDPQHRTMLGIKN